jgi:hypothetical protein
MYSYHDQHGHLPPAVVYGPDGQPLLSWRVLLLPCVAEESLYQEFRLDEPWDSPHNLRLLPRMPTVYALPGRKKSLVPDCHTVCHVFLGKGTPFEGPVGLPMAQAFANGTCNTLLIVEAGKPVPWTKPDELLYDPDGPLPDLRCVFRDGFRAALGDGSSLFINKETSEATLRAAITRNGPKPSGPGWNN